MKQKKRTVSEEREYQQHLVRMGKGRARAMKPIECRVPYYPAFGQNSPVDPKQSAINKGLGYW